MAGLVCTYARAFARVGAVVCAILTLSPAAAAAQDDVVLHTSAATLHGDWQQVADAAAAGGRRVWNPDRGAAKLTAPYAAPADYFELSFYAERGRAYRLWARGRADNNSWKNDSVFVQFSGAVTDGGAPQFRIGSTSATVVSIEAGSARGLSGWGWEDNGWDSFGPAIYFETTGLQTLRVQRREDGISLDQLVLSPSNHTGCAPGASKDDATILPESTGAPVADSKEVIIGTSTPSAIAGAWRIADDTTAAGGKAAATADNGTAKVGVPLASPANYVEYTFTADAGRAYRLWMRGRAESDYWANDSVHVQFSGSLAIDGQPYARIGSTTSHVVNLEEASNAGLAGWGWQDNGYGTGVLGPLVMFASSGPQTIRIQTREDGFRIDQIVLSSERFLTLAPGPLKNDTTLLVGATGGGETGASLPPAEEPLPEPEPAPVPEPSEPAPAPGTPVSLRVLDWNLHHGVGTDGVYDIERIANWMVKMKPDVILLNEVERYTGWGNEDQPERYRAMLEAKTGRRWYSHFTQEYGQWSSPGKGHQILSVYPLDATGHTTTTFSSGLKGAGAIGQATITVNGRTLNFVVAHLEPYDATVRLVQAQEVIRYAAGFAENRILTGDMNAWPDDASIAEFGKTYNDSWMVAAGMGTATGVDGITPWGATKKGRIDYIFVSKQAPDVSVVDVTVVDTRDAAGIMPSDHRPVLATLSVK